MKFGGIVSAAALVLGLALAGPASAQVVGAFNICEPAGGQVNTVRLQLMSPSVLDFMFKRLSDGQTYNFAATGAVTTRKFALPAGTYKLTFKHPNSSPIGTYPQNVVVKDFRVIGGDCRFVTPLDKAQQFQPSGR